MKFSPIPKSAGTMIGMLLEQGEEGTRLPNRWSALGQHFSASRNPLSQATSQGLNTSILHLPRYASSVGAAAQRLPIIVNSI